MDVNELNKALNKYDNELLSEHIKNHREFLNTAINIVKLELKKNKDGGSFYHNWQSNLAMIIMDNSDLDHEKCNEIACLFLDILIGDK